MVSPKHPHLCIEALVALCGLFTRFLVWGREKGSVQRGGSWHCDPEAWTPIVPLPPIQCDLRIFGPQQKGTGLSEGTVAGCVGLLHAVKDT